MRFTLTKAVTRPILVLELASAWIVMQFVGVAISDAFEKVAASVILIFVGDRIRTHIWGDKDIRQHEAAELLERGNAGNNETDTAKQKDVDALAARST